MSEISETINIYRSDITGYQDLYKHLHQNPELSFQEQDTAAPIFARLTSLLDAFPSIQSSIHTEIGPYGHAAVLCNNDEHGGCPTVLLHAEVDALSVEEQTRLEYASKKRMIALDGIEKPVMHACGHDMRVSALIAAAELLLRLERS